jgi:hypothetical protein
MKERKAFLMRIDPALWEQLEAWAQDELRSVNGQIEMILRQAVQRRRGTDSKQQVQEKMEPQD